MSGFTTLDQLDVAGRRVLVRADLNVPMQDGRVPDATRMQPNFTYYGLALAAILLIGYASLAGWLPAPLLLLVSFVAIFWLFSFVFALVTTLRDKARPGTRSK